MVAGRRAVNGAADLPVAPPWQGRLPAHPVEPSGRAPCGAEKVARASWPGRRRDIFYATINGTTESGA